MTRRSSRLAQQQPLQAGPSSPFPSLTPSPPLRQYSFPTDEPIKVDPSELDSSSPPQVAAVSSPVLTLPDQLPRLPSLGEEIAIAKMSISTHVTGFVAGVSDFTGDAAISAKDWLNKFEVFCLDRDIDENLPKKAKYFGRFMAGSARDWYETLAENVRSHYPLLEEAFLKQFKHLGPQKETPSSRHKAYLTALEKPKTVEAFRDLKAWQQWLTEILGLSVKVDRTFVSDAYMAEVFWGMVPFELKAYLGGIRAFTSSAESINACLEVSPVAYEEILAKHDADVQGSREEVQREVQRAMQVQRRCDIFPPSPPEEKRARFESSSQSPGPGGYARLTPPTSSIVNVTTIPQLTFADDNDGHRQYEEALKRYAREHPRTTVSPPAHLAYPLTPGTSPPGTGECHRCGQRGHLYNQCTAERPVPQAEQAYRRNYSQAIAQARLRLPDRSARLVKIWDAPWLVII